MLAILYSVAANWQRALSSALWSLTIGALCVIAATHIAFGAPNQSMVARAEEQFATARIRYDADKTNALAAVAFGRSAFDLAEFATADRQRESIATQGINACRQAIRLKPDLGAAHHYLALNLGQLARTKKLKALGLIEEMESAWLKAIELDPHFEHGGPHRSLGMLYLDAPGWPVSVGNRTKARKHLEKAVQLDPEYPENYLVLIEAYLKWKDASALNPHLKALERLWPKAKEKLRGPEWEDEWVDWTERWRKIQEDFSFLPEN